MNALPVANENKGQDFVSQRALKNQLLNKSNDTVALNKTVNLFSVQSLKVFSLMTRSLESLNKNISKISITSEKDKFLRKEDQNVKLYKAVDDLEGLMRENNQMQKDKDKKGKGLLGSLLGFVTGNWIGGLLGTGLIGGLLGYLFFGQDKYIQSARDALKKVGGFIKDKVLDPIGQAITDWWDSGGKEQAFGAMKKIGEGFVDNLGKLWEWAKENPKMAIGGGLLAALLTGNLGGLTRLSASLAGLSLDVVSQMIKHPGFALVLASAGAIAFAAFKGKEALDTEKKVREEADQRARNEQILAADRYKKQNWSPEDITSNALDLDRQKQLEKKLYQPKNILLGSAAKTAAKAGGFLAGAIAGPATAVLGYKAGKKIGAFAEEKLTGTNLKNRAKMEQEMHQLAISRGKRAQKYGKYIPEPSSLLETLPPNVQLEPGANLKGVNSDTLSDFIGLAGEYGKPIHVNSAFRTYEEQQALYNKDPTKAVNPAEGTSRHQLGYAFDIATKGSEGFKGINLLGKYGFRRPVGDEPWHIEHKNATGQSTKSDSSEEGDPNLPKNIIARRMNKDDTSLSLSESTIKSLALSIGGAFKNSWPTVVPDQISINTSMRG